MSQYLRPVAGGEQVTAAYPDERDHRRRWRALARAIAADATPTETQSPAVTPGELVIVGSGIEAVGFTTADETRIRDAEDVFYCVADPATKVWLNSVRPDALDLYVLYDDAKPRYHTYVQMSEAILHPVRRGRRVVAVFYGHPGVFVLSTHRAVRIARREGHRAEMRAGISALDTLCADLGVDPSQPGMAMYEATDLLIRRRRPDTGLHVVLWQVGLVGELGYRRQGYINANFTVLLDYLEELYGDADQAIVNYVGSRYPGVEPVIGHHTIASLRDPDSRAWITGISTFYLPPRQVAPSDRVMLERLGLIGPGQPLRDPDSPLRVIDAYGAREQAARAEFGRFDVPASYVWQPDTAPARFILALCDDDGLRAQYRADPAGAVAAWGGGMTTREREMLARRDAGALQLAAKGRARTTNQDQHRRALAHLIGRRSATAALRQAVERAGPPGARAAAEQWSRSAGLAIDWETFPADVERGLYEELAAWTGLYLDGDRELSLSIHAHPGRSRSSRVECDGVRIHRPRFEHGSLSWSVDDGNDTTGRLQADTSPRGRRQLVGLVWPAGERPQSCHRVRAVEHRSHPRVPLASLVGTYRASGSDGIEHTVTVQVVTGDTDDRRVAVAVDGAPVADPISVVAGRIDLDGWTMPLRRVSATTLDPSLHGRYVARVQHLGEVRLVSLELSASSLVLDGESLDLFEVTSDGCAWRDGPEGMATGRLQGLIDPITLRPMLHGTIESSSGTPSVVRAMVPIEPAVAARLVDQPGDGLPAWAWAHVVDIVARTSDKGGIFLWHGWDRTAVNRQRLRRVLGLVRADLSS